MLDLVEPLNFTDIHPFKVDEDVSTRYITGKDEIKNADMIIIPGSKNTIGDFGEYVLNTIRKEKI